MIGELAELKDWFRATFSGWRFMFSPSYRRKMRQHWEHERWPHVLFDIACGLLGIAFSFLLAYLLIRFLVITS